MYNYLKIVTSATAAILVASLMSACTSNDKPKEVEYKKNVDHAIIEEATKSEYEQVHYLYADKRMDFGETPTAEQIAAWDIDVRPDGLGLPEGKGSVADGEEIYQQKCALCHGDFGEGADRWPPLAGGEGSLKSQRMHGEMEAPHKTIGSYWPYLSTVFDYIKRAMPYPAPQSLTDDEVYAITAYLLYLNEIKVDGEEIDEDFVLSKDNFSTVKLPNEKNFTPSRDSIEVTRPDVFNERCMKDCKSEDFKEIEVLKGVTPLGPFKRGADQEGKKPAKAESPMKGLYDNKCSICHTAGIAGAPKLGDKAAWKSIVAQGKDTIYSNALNGKDAMPPKGGDMSLSDADVKSIVDYMIDLSK